jgi:putative N6-adenine-specific DNA methylase
LENHTLIAKTLAGLEDVLSNEIRQIGGQNIKKVRRAVIFDGDKKMIYRANYQLRTALRILKQIISFNFHSVDDFYLQCRAVKWDGLMSEKKTFVVFGTVSNSKEFRNSMFASLKVKDAIVDYFRQKTGTRPIVDTIKPDIIFNVHISEHSCTLSVDSSGESLHKRGYRIAQSDAPLNEVLAAGMILLSGWKGETDFVDPMCGSGTLPIEAVLIATSTPPGIFRKKFGFESWADFDDELFGLVADEAEPKKLQKTIYASDISTRNIDIAKTNAQNARVTKEIKFEVADFKALKIQVNGASLMINPPYGERLRSNDLENLYEMIGERLKHVYAGNDAWILSSSKEYFNKIGLKHSEKIELYNGAIKCDFRKYELYLGKKNAN